MTSGRVLLLLLDGLGVGAMADVADVRPEDAGSDSLAHALAEAPASLPQLERLGLGHAAPTSGLDSETAPLASWGRSELGYPGADSYLGHQVLMGGDVSEINLEPFSRGIASYEAALHAAGRHVRRHETLPVLVVDEAMVVAESLEADPGMNYNVTGSTAHATFEQIADVARLIRRFAPVPRVIAVGGKEIGVEDIIDSLTDSNGVIGVDTPALGIYGNGVELLHFGKDFGFATQAQNRVAELGLPVFLVGKMADIVSCPVAERFPAVDTGEVLSLFENAIDLVDEGLVAVNVQELDLAGHRESSDAFVQVLVKVDQSLGRVRRELSDRDLLLITGDHGDDPTYGRLHTREEVPLLAYSPRSVPCPLSTRRTLADVGATIADWLGASPTATGDSFKDLVR